MSTPYRGANHNNPPVLSTSIYICFYEHTSDVMWFGINLAFQLVVIFSTLLPLP